jgi:hypothetical protein
MHPPQPYHSFHPGQAYPLQGTNPHFFLKIFRKEWGGENMREEKRKILQSGCYEKNLPNTLLSFLII